MRRVSLTFRLTLTTKISNTSEFTLTPYYQTKDEISVRMVQLKVLYFFKTVPSTFIIILHEIEAHEIFYFLQGYLKNKQFI